MAFDVVITKTAEDDINEAISYIAVVLSNPIAATTLADDYVEAISRIADNPFLFHYFKDGEGNNTPYRRCNIRNFSLFFRVEGTTVIICRFLYARRNLFSLSMEIDQS